MPTEPDTRICYRAINEYKYLLQGEYVHTGIDVKLLVDEVASHGGFVRLTKDQRLVIKDQYAWDGPSGPTVDTKTFMRGSLVHDALYQLLRDNAFGPGTSSLSREQIRLYADDVLYAICAADRMGRFRRWYVKKAVNVFARGAIRRRKKPTPAVVCAP